MSRGATLVLAVFGALAAASCGGSSKSTTTTSGTTHSSSTSTRKGAPPPLQTVAAHVEGASPGNSASASPGTTVVIVVRVPQADASKPLNVAIDQTGPTTFTATSTVVGTPLRQTSQIHESAGNVQIAYVRWKCLYPKDSFCPVHVAAASPTHVLLSPVKHVAPLKLSVLIDHPGATKPPSLLPLGLPGPGSAVQATTMLRAVAPATGGKKQQPSPPSTSVTATPGSTLDVTVRVPPGSPAHSTLRIAVPHTSGHSIVVEAGGTAGSPASTATVTSSSGNIRITGVSWGCRTPPATFCPFRSIHTTSAGLEIALSTPRVPVELTMSTDKG